jgi:ABC-type bacteriocin/lantibiotic exporter with double-glycine peptidase domain
MNMMPILASVLVFGVFVAVNGADQLQTANVYTTLSLFNLMANPMRMLVMTVVQMANANASLSRVNHFFQYPEANSDGVDFSDKELKAGEIKIDDAEFRWETN